MDNKDYIIMDETYKNINEFVVARYGKSFNELTPARIYHIYWLWRLYRYKVQKYSGFDPIDPTFAHTSHLYWRRKKSSSWLRNEIRKNREKEKTEFLRWQKREENIIKGDKELRGTKIDSIDVKGHVLIPEYIIEKYVHLLIDEGAKICIKTIFSNRFNPKITRKYEKDGYHWMNENWDKYKSKKNK